MNRTNDHFNSGPKDARPLSDEAVEQIPGQRSVEDSPDPDDSLVRQMSHNDESFVRDGSPEKPVVVGYQDAGEPDKRSEEGTREYDKE